MEVMEDLNPLIEALIELDHDIEGMVDDNKTSEKLLVIRSEMEKEMAVFIKKYMSQLEKLRHDLG